LFKCDYCEKRFQKHKAMTSHRRWHNLPEYKEFQKKYRSDVTKKHNGLKLSEEETQILLGSLLGDGSLAIMKNGINAFYREMHGGKQKEYLLWKSKFLDKLLIKIKSGNYFDKRTKKTYNQIALWSKTHPILTKLQNLFYSHNKKIVKKAILDQLIPLGLTIWYLDDGFYNYGQNRCYLSTHCFSHNEHILIKKHFKDRWNIEVQIHKDGKNYFTCFSKENSTRFLNLIKSFVPQSMNYKLGHILEKNRQKIETKDIMRKENEKIRRLKNPEKYKEFTRNSYKKNKEKYVAKAKEYYSKNQDQILEKKKEYYDKNKKKILKSRINYNKTYYLENREKIITKQRIYKRKTRLQKTLIRGGTNSHLH
jgi:hypothetical protein